MNNGKNQRPNQKPTVFILYNWGSDTVAEKIEGRLKPYSDVK